MTMNVPEPKLKDKSWSCYTWMAGKEGTDRLINIGQVEAPDHGTALSEAEIKFGRQVVDYIDPLVTREISTGKKGFKLQEIEDRG